MAQRCGLPSTVTHEQIAHFPFQKTLETLFSAEQETKKPLVDFLGFAASAIFRLLMTLDSSNLLICGGDYDPNKVAHELTFQMDFRSGGGG